MKFGVETICYGEPRLWANLPVDNKLTTPLSDFKAKIKSWRYGSSRPEVLLGKGVLKICSKFAGEHQCQSAISIKLLCKTHFGIGVLL